METIVNPSKAYFVECNRSFFVASWKMCPTSSTRTKRTAGLEFVIDVRSALTTGISCDSPIEAGFFVEFSKYSYRLAWNLEVRFFEFLFGSAVIFSSFFVVFLSGATSYSISSSVIIWNCFVTLLVLVLQEHFSEKHYSSVFSQHIFKISGVNRSVVVVNV